MRVWRKYNSMHAVSMILSGNLTREVVLLSVARCLDIQAHICQNFAQQQLSPLNSNLNTVWLVIIVMLEAQVQAAKHCRGVQTSTKRDCNAIYINF
jgi:hypothetical protein